MECRSFLILALPLVFATACGNSVQSNSLRTSTAECEPQEVPHTFVVRWKGSIPEEFRPFQTGPSGKLTRFTNTTREIVNREVMAKFGDQIEVGEPEYILETESPRPQYFQPQTLSGSWGFSNVEAENAWTKVGEGNSTLVAVVDSGLEMNHPAFQGQIFQNTKEVPNNGVDDDGNGLIDDFMGYDFGDGTSQMLDYEGHGTHVSGIIAARKDSQFPGVAPGAKILPVKFLDKRGYGYMSAALEALAYAGKMGAKVVNASWGGGSCSAALLQEIKTLTSHGTVFANSAGNSGRDLSKSPEYPAAYTIPGKITVGSSDKDNALSYFSNFGVLVDLVAPGRAITSTYKGGSYATLDGTSMASPFVAGVSALLFGASNEVTSNDVVTAINDSAVYFNYPVRTRGRLNADAAATLLKSRLGL